jgi:hypothetical protein
MNLEANQLTNKLAVWNRFLTEKQVLSQVVDIFLFFYGSRKFITLLTIQEGLCPPPKSIYQHGHKECLTGPYPEPAESRSHRHAQSAVHFNIILRSAYKSP